MTGNAGREWDVWQYVSLGAIAGKLCLLAMACDLFVDEMLKKLSFMTCLVLFFFIVLCAKNLVKKDFFRKYRLLTYTHHMKCNVLLSFCCIPFHKQSTGLDAVTHRYKE